MSIVDICSTFKISRDVLRLQLFQTLDFVNMHANIRFVPAVKCDPGNAVRDTGSIVERLVLYGTIALENDIKVV